MKLFLEKNVFVSFISKSFKAIMRVCFYLFLENLEFRKEGLSGLSTHRVIRIDRLLVREQHCKVETKELDILDFRHMLKHLYS